MSFFGDLFSGTKHHLGDMWGKVKDDPERLFLGAMTPLGTAVWGGALGKDWESGTNMFGGQTEAQFRAGEADGINMGPSRNMGAVADTIAGFYGGQGAISGLGNAWGSMGSGGNVGGTGVGNYVDTAGTNVTGFGQSAPSVGNYNFGFDGANASTMSQGVGSNPFGNTQIASSMSANPFGNPNAVTQGVDYMQLASKGMNQMAQMQPQQQGMLPPLQQQRTPIAAYQYQQPQGMLPQQTYRVTGR